MAVRAIGLCVVGLWACLTLMDLPHWQSTRALWTRAVVISPRSPRALLNLGIETRKAGDIDQAVDLFVRAAREADRFPNPDELRGRVRAQLTWLRAFGHAEYCQRPDVRPFCF